MVLSAHSRCFMNGGQGEVVRQDKNLTSSISHSLNNVRLSRTLCIQNLETDFSSMILQVLDFFWFCFWFWGFYLIVKFRGFFPLLVKIITFLNVFRSCFQAFSLVKLGRKLREKNVNIPITGSDFSDPANTL